MEHSAVTERVEGERYELKSELLTAKNEVGSDGVSHKDLSSFHH